jgi:hypothetical protein
MAKRIIEETTSSGNVRFRVETNDGWFGLRKRWNIWVTCSYTWEDNTYDAIFQSLSEAERYCIDSDDKVVERKTVRVYGF